MPCGFDMVEIKYLGQLAADLIPVYTVESVISSSFQNI